jgi:hypothetical protein
MPQFNYRKNQTFRRKTWGDHKNRKNVKIGVDIFPGMGHVISVAGETRQWADWERLLRFTLTSLKPPFSIFAHIF